jgi:hypothetical protein
MREKILALSMTTRKNNGYKGGIATVSGISNFIPETNH